MEAPPFWGENTIASSRFHEPPQPEGTSHSDCSGPPQDLDGDGAVEAGVAGLVYLAERAGADRGEDFIRAELFACLEQHISVEVQFSRSGS